MWSGPNVDREIMPKKMAEFLVHDCFPWTGILGIGVIDNTVATDVKQILQNSTHQPRVDVIPAWYY